MIRLATQMHVRPYEETGQGPLFRPCAPNSVLARLGDKWPILVMSHLALAPDHRLRFSSLKNSTEGIIQRMPTLTLRNLEGDSLLLRHHFPEVLPWVEWP